MRGLSILVLAVGNKLLSDDGVGIHIVEALQQEKALSTSSDIVFRDGGTLGLALLPDIENASAVIVVDAAEIGGAPGTVRLFEAVAMDTHLKGKKRTAHELAVADLMDAAALTGHLPDQRALVAVQPETTEWGLTPSAAVAAAMPQACAVVRSLIERWRRETGTHPQGNTAAEGDRNAQSQNAR